MTGHPPRDVDDRLADWVDGRMSDKERERFVAELRVNTQLRQDLERYERTVGVLRAALRAPSPSAGIADRVMAAIAAPASAPVRRFPMRRMGWGLAAAAAALAAAVWIDAWMPAPRSGQDTAAVDRAEGAAVASQPPADEEQAPAAKPDATEAAKKLAETDRQRAAGDLVLGPEEKRVAPAQPVPTPARELADGKVAEVPGTRAAVAQEDRRASGAGPGDTVPPPAAPSTPSPSGPATGGPGTRPLPVAPDAARLQEETRKEAGEDRPTWREAERADAPVSLIVVEGLAVTPATGDAKSELAKDKSARRAAPTVGGAEGGKAQNGASTGRDDFYARLDGAVLEARIDEFLAGAAAPGTAAAAIAWWTPRGELRLSPMVEAKPEAAPRAVTGTAGGQPPIERTWLVEGTRADVEVLLARLTRFAQQHQLTRRTEETKLPVEQPPAGKNANELVDQPGTTSTLQAPVAGQARAEVQRIVLRFRLRLR